MPGEAARHFIDLDMYPDSMSPFNSSYAQITARINEHFVQLHGIGPWNIQDQFWALVNAMAKQDHTRIVRIAGELGHYIADLHVPLHTSSNYDGQKTNQRGIHGF
ncbi:phospholipase C/P1 nuclease family protein [Gynurincola endophyticus]|uniref:hypothetical protein n=1 Tax=Gynurincola endophyticus TaxID=2479004 RepID=UPI000F8DB5DA|nr:hypothetical protein [Gynurincola endophyticus]